MKPFLRILLVALAGLWLIVCARTAVLWVRSYFLQDWIDYQITDDARNTWTGYTFASNRGSLFISKSQQRFKQKGKAWVYSATLPSPEGFSYHQFPTHENDMLAGSFFKSMGFLVVLNDETIETDGTFSYPRAFFPHWFIILVAAMLPAWLLRRAILRRRWRSKGLCRQCGYDLRASPERCPECGLSRGGESAYRDRIP